MNMDKQEMEKINHKDSSSRVWTGLIILVTGLVFLLDNIGINIPHWIISWPTAVIVIGLLVGYKRNFQPGIWMVMVLLGGFFMLEAATSYNMSKYYFALMFIVLGIYLIFKPKGSGNAKEKWKKRWKDRCSSEKVYDIDRNDILESISIFAGSHQKVYSKNFKGGEVVAVFGGSDINLTQADFEGTIAIDVVAIFGGLKIIIPPGWEVRSEVAAIFGGIDDKRTIAAPVEEPSKIIIIKGVAVFGGVDIRNF